MVRRVSRIWKGWKRDTKLPYFIFKNSGQVGEGIGNERIADISALFHQWYGLEACQLTSDGWQGGG